MKYIGTSLGGCLLSIMNGEVSADEVMFIVTRTNCPDYVLYVDVVKDYHSQGNPYAQRPELYALNDHPLEKVIELASRLWHSGRIHQPRTFVGDGSGRPFRHPAGYGHGLWMQVVPTNQSTHPSVVEAWEKYKMLDELTK
jgi:hypothetical protein